MKLQSLDIDQGMNLIVENLPLDLHTELLVMELFIILNLLKHTFLIHLVLLLLCQEAQYKQKVYLPHVLKAMILVYFLNQKHYID
jgi:hypothetical protein